MTRLLRARHIPRGLFYAASGCSVAIGCIGWPQLKLQADSGRQEQWPNTRPLAASPGVRPIKQTDTKARDSDQTDSISQSSVTSQDDDVPLFEDEESAAWAAFSSRFATARQSISSIEWSSLGDKIADRVLPEWTMALPRYIDKLQKEVEMVPGSLAYEIWQEAQDPDFHPDIKSRARVRIGKDLCSDETAFVQRRKRFTTRALSSYLNIPEDQIDPQDVPTIAVCGSGGGLRALVAGAASYLSAQEVLECATYTAGVSGSCWLQTLYHSSIGGQSFQRVIDHLKRRIGTHIAYPPSLLDLLTRAPTNKYLLSGSVEKLNGDPNGDFGIVDVYGVLLAARLLVPRDELSLEPGDLKLSNQRSYLSDGQNPLPIYAAVRHEIPIEEHLHEGDQVSKAIKEKAKREAWFQWFEFTPYELWCEELEAGIPAWGIGKLYSGGRSILRKDGIGIPEHGLPFLLGMWGSAFCATLAHYYKEVRPVLKGLAGFGGIDDLIEERNEDLIRLHPIDPGAIPNYALGLEGELPGTCPSSIFKDKYLALMDAGMSNNLPLYPLLREGRDVDIIVCFDASADIKQENWLSVADGYAKQRGLRGWPIGAGWPKSSDGSNQELEAADAATAQQAAGKVAEAREAQRTRKRENQSTSPARTRSASNQSDEEIGYCNVWVGTTLERTSESEPPPSKRVQPEGDADWRLMDPDAGITVVYFPLLPNPQAEGVDPDTSPFLSTWNFIYSPEEVDKVVQLAKANFEAGKEQTRRTVRAVYERKKAKRLQAEEQARIRHWKKQLREHGDQFR